MKRKVVVFTGNRAEYGLQLPIIRELKKNKKIICYVLISGAHTQKKYGMFLNQIKRDKIKINKVIHLKKVANTTKDYTPKLIGDATIKISSYFKKIKPDIVLINADRHETFAACIASSQMNIPTFHIEGGDVTNGGVFDDSVRHAISKLSHIHFTTNKKSFNNLIKLGEEKWRIFNYGLSINDIIYNSKKLSLDKIKKIIPISFNKPVIIFTLHPVTSDIKKILNSLKESLRAINFISKKYNCSIIGTYPNNDYGSDLIIKALKNNKNPNFHLVKNLSIDILHSLLAHSKENKIIVVGNSSMGIKEAIAFKTPVVNIGGRQDGRLKPNNVLDADVKSENIKKNIYKALFNKKFRLACDRSKNPYFMKNTSQKIVKIISGIKLNNKIINKKFVSEKK